MAVNVKLGVDLSQFTSGIREGQSIMKGLNAEMKAAEAEFKATGNAEQLLTTKTKTLNSQIQIQKGIADQAAQALKAMTDAGIKPTDAAYQKLYATMMNATAGMNNAQAELNGLSGSAQGAAASADQLTTSVQNIGKKISLDQVITGIDKITSGLEAAAKKAIELGKELWNSVMDSAMLADDIATQARVFDMTPELYQRYKGVFETIGEVTMQEWGNVRRKVEKAMEDPSNDQIDVIKALGFGGMTGGKGSVTEEAVKLTADNWEDAFWAVSTEIKKRVESGEISLATADVWGEAMFGKKYSNLKTLIDLGPEAFAEALTKQNVASQEAVETDSALADAQIKLTNSYEALKMELSSGLAPALTDAATAMDGLLGQILEYLKTEEGQEMMKSLGESVSELFSGIKNISVSDVVEGFKTAFDGLINGLNWILTHKNELISALEAIVAGWAGLKLSGGVLNLMKLVDGLRELGILGGGSVAGAAASASGAGASVGGAASFFGKIAQATSTSLNNLGVVGDWLTHESPFGAVFQGQETLGEMFSRTISEIQSRAASFASDWANNPLISMWTNFGMNQDAATRLPEGADWRPSYMKDQQPVVEMEPVLPADAAATITEQVGETELPVDLVSQTDAAGIAEQVGPITLPATLQVFGFGGFGGGTFDFIKGYANGLNYVPYDGMLARLHKGEQVVPAREVQSRSFNSNLYVESMYMNNGTDAAGLASAMASAQQRVMSGFGS